MRIRQAIVHWLNYARRPRQNPSPDSVADGLLHTWTNAQLAAVWRATGAELRRAVDSPRAIAVAQARQLLIGEIERRYPTQTRAWLNTPAAFSDEPPEFLRTNENT